MSIGYNSSVRTYSVVWGLKDATGKDFKHLDSFHVFNNRQEGTEAFTVSWSMVRRLRYRISSGEGLSQTDINQGWNKHFVFWAYPHNGRWFPPPYQGFVPALGNGMPGNCTVPPRVPSHISSSTRLERAKRHNTVPPRARLPPGEGGAMGLKRQITIDNFKVDNQIDK